MRDFRNSSASRVLSATSRILPIPALIGLVFLLLLPRLGIAELARQGPRLVGTSTVWRGFHGEPVALSSDGHTATVRSPSDNNVVGGAWAFARSGRFGNQKGSRLVGWGATEEAGQGSPVGLAVEADKRSPRDTFTPGSWVSLSYTNSVNRGGVYGSRGAFGDLTYPGSRVGAAAWATSDGILWLFGGRSGSGYLNDLWKIDRTRGFAWWTGSSGFGALGAYGTKGVPSAINTPGAREGSVFWTDGNGGLWLFGGDFSPRSQQLVRFNDLWRFDVASGMWTWVSGSDSYDQPGSYGVRGVPSSSNVPGARNAASGWVDANGDLWLFGGISDSSGNPKILSDLWRFSVSTGVWTWMGGSNQPNQPAAYGIRGAPSPSNTPGARDGMTVWLDLGGDLWLFGGETVASGTAGGLSDLWKRETSSGNWTWMGGSTLLNERSVYGTLGEAATTNSPGARVQSCGWVDAAGGLILFGGAGYAEMYGGTLNDTWRFDPGTAMWTWRGGNTTPDEKPVYRPIANPGGMSYAAAWSDGSGGGIVFAGYGKNASGEQGYLDDIWWYTSASASLCYTLSTDTSPVGVGSVTVNTPSNCSGGYTASTGVSLTANTPAGYSFSGWSGTGGTFSNGSASPTVFTINGNANVTATFTPASPPGCTISCLASAASAGQTGQSLSFTSSATPSNCNGSVGYAWDFGDGQTSGSQNPSHVYSSAGTYSWTLTSSVGSTQCQKSGSITITAASSCSMSCSASAPSSGQTGQSLSFTSSATPANCSGSVGYSWDFGDGQSSGSQNTSHSYSSLGTYSWTLTASVGGVQCQRTENVTISGGSTVITEFSAGISSAAHPFGITAGPDGNLWFAEGNGNRIGRITTNGTVTEFSSGISAGATPIGIATGSDGNLWFTEGNGSRIGRISTSGAVTEFSTGISPRAGPWGIAAGPDGNLWFTESAGNRIGRIDTKGVVTEFSSGLSPGSAPWAITVGPDGNLWFTESTGNRIGRITTTGVITEFSSGLSAGAGLWGITTGPDGNLWFTENTGNRIGRITTAGAITEFSAGISAGAGPLGIAAAHDGNVWFTEGIGNRIGRITTTGLVTEFSAGMSAGASPWGITTGPDGNLWFTESGLSRIGEVSVSPSSDSCAPSSTALCLLGNRFRVTAAYADYSNNRGAGRAVALTPDTGYFWFFNSANVEAVVKMVPFCGSASNNVAVYANGLTDLSVTLSVTDTRTNQTTTYSNALGTGFQLIRDGPFGCPSEVTPGGEEPESTASCLRAQAADSSDLVGPTLLTTCVADSQTLCLLNNRFQVRASYTDYSYRSGAGSAVGITSDTGYFWFFGSSNVEVVTKMVAFCGSGTNNVGIYTSGLTDLGVTLVVTDTQTGLVRTYSNSLGKPFNLIRDGPFSCQ